ncbi:MAG: right-handed parallel beta-helix repeat-containing protein, partial [Gammaproteobacteria bacterium]|nr:right-handed parallel beta-helix repeat-containing protein [Gammaproteobacteria bacterium]
DKWGVLRAYTEALPGMTTSIPRPTHPTPPHNASRVATLLTVLSIVLLPLCAQARCLITVAPGDDVRGKWNEAAAGNCSLHFEAGTHVVTARLGRSFAGTAEDPVVVSGEGAALTTLLRPDANQNIIDVGGTHFELRDMALTGGSRGIRLTGDTSAARFTRLAVHGTQDNAFSANDVGTAYTGIEISHSEFYDTNGAGECLYLGCNNDGCTFGDSLVAYNYCHDTFSTQGTSQGDGLDLKGGTFNVVVRGNVFVNTYGPGILTYANGGRAQNIIEGNVVWMSGDVGIQATGDALIRNNIVVVDGLDVPAMNASGGNQGTPNNLQIINNTVVMPSGTGNCLEARNWQAPAQNMVIANNALFCPGREALRTVNVDFGIAQIVANAIEGGTNVPSGTFPAGTWQSQLTDVATANVYPVAGSALIAAGDSRYAAADDFNCLTRDRASADVGAYSYSGDSNPGWTVENSFKTCIEATPSVPVPLLPARLIWLCLALAVVFAWLYSIRARAGGHSHADTR